MKSRSSLINILFLCCYLPYSILPLSYAVEGSGEPSCYDHHRASLFQKMTQNAVETVQEGMFEDLPQKDDAPAATRVLLRKKRALSVSAKDLRAKPPFVSAVPRQEQRDDVFTSMDDVLRQGRDGYCGHRCYYSGTAPPVPGGLL